MTLNDGISIIMPTYNQGAYISRAIASVRLQTFKKWELIIINDGSTDYTQDVLNEFINEDKIKIYSNLNNEGLGNCLNKGVDLAQYDFIAYLPSDDIYYASHLYTLKSVLDNSHHVLAFSGLLHHYYDSSSDSRGIETNGKIHGASLQLVQVLHRKTSVKWTEREELTTDSLDHMFWDKLIEKGGFAGTNSVTCEWVDHPEQRHKIINEAYGGGIYLYKQFYNVTKPLIFKSSNGIFVDEWSEYARFRNTVYSKSDDPLKILIVGELSYNPERLLAFEERGHQLYGLWLNSPSYYNATGPLPFGNIIDIPIDTWVEKVREINPDIIYALLNHQAVPFANYVLKNDLKIPFVWHFKEGPFKCRQNGIWKELIELFVNADSRIFLNAESKAWFNLFLSVEENATWILDGDLPKQEWFFGTKTKLISEEDGEIHTVISGRPYGLTKELIKQLIEEKIHLHFYGDMYNSFWKNDIVANSKDALHYIHIHPQCRPEDWISELSRYDAGWLHLFDSNNFGEYMKVNWPDLNYPARISTLAAAGIPMLLKNNSGHIVATQSMIEKFGIGILFDSIPNLGTQLRNKKHLDSVRKNVEEQRLKFSFDYHVDDLISFFRQTISRYGENTNINDNQDHHN